MAPVFKTADEVPAVAFRRHWAAVEAVARDDVLDDDVGAHLYRCDGRPRYRLHLFASDVARGAAARTLRLRGLSLEIVSSVRLQTLQMDAVRDSAPGHFCS